MQERIFNKNAEIEFNKSMVECQREMPIVLASSLNEQTKSFYVKYEHLLKYIKPVYTKYGFSMSFGELPCAKENMITVTCELMHSGGHSKSFSSTLPIDSCGIKGTVNKTGIHATASAYSYAKRYLATMIFNIAVSDHDDDAINAGGLYIDDMLEHQAKVRELFFSVSTIKEGILNKDYSSAAEAWFELDNDEKQALWVAPSKGGIFTTEERKIMMTREFRESYYGAKEDEPES